MEAFSLLSFLLLITLAHVKLTHKTSLYAIHLSTFPVLYILSSQVVLESDMLPFNLDFHGGGKNLFICLFEFWFGFVLFGLVLRIESRALVFVEHLFYH